MILLSVTPTTKRVRVYSCARGSLVRTRLMDEKFNMVPSAEQLEELRKRPHAFIASLPTDDEAA